MMYIKRKKKCTTRMHSSRVLTFHCSGRLSYHAQTHPLPHMSPCHRCPSLPHIPPATHAPCHAHPIPCMPPAIPTATPHCHGLPCMPLHLPCTSPTTCVPHHTRLPSCHTHPSCHACPLQRMPPCHACLQ